ncbi:hypothetical protein F9B85_11395 [Heliorestis acidaminivorans]|uniref:Uncharacterized protein n=1 Tax=Heliorestis acidaminivorans TaxID=553427 RepID=A0A6I0EY65_9FIRM|nr:hypothetical protein [Heliorestis acidaminivorans]KAB2951632.1 hypothetical protein F9B85_11395 [Heliorestis acidaminivorans]
MPLSFNNCSGLSNDSLVNDIYNEIISNVKLFPYIARIFCLYKNNNNANTQVFEKILDNPNLSLNATYKDKIINILSEIYNHPKFSDIRSGILEKVIHGLGPFKNTDCHYDVYIEPSILDNGYVVGESNCKCDIVYHTSDDMPIEFIECKSNITNFIPRTLPFDDERVKQSTKNKVHYLDKAYNYLTNNYVTPTILFACYNAEHALELENVHHNWGFPYIDFLGSQEIFYKLSQYNPVIRG